MRRFFRSLFSLAGPVFAIALMVVCFRNVFWDDTEAMAAETACDGRSGCRAQMIREMHTPIGHTYRFVIAKGQIEITCRRAYLLEGAYTCTDKAFDPLSRPNATASASAPATPAPWGSARSAHKSQP